MFSEKEIIFWFQKNGERWGFFFPLGSGKHQMVTTNKHFLRNQAKRRSFLSLNGQTVQLYLKSEQERSTYYHYIRLYMDCNSRVTTVKNRPALPKRDFCF